MKEFYEYDEDFDEALFYGEQEDDWGACDDDSESEKAERFDDEYKPEEYLLTAEEERLLEQSDFEFEKLLLDEEFELFEDVCEAVSKDKKCLDEEVSDEVRRIIQARYAAFTKKPGVYMINPVVLAKVQKAKKLLEEVIAQEMFHDKKDTFKVKAFAVTRAVIEIRREALSSHSTPKLLQAFALADEISFGGILNERVEVSLFFENCFVRLPDEITE